VLCRVIRGCLLWSRGYRQARHAALTALMTGFVLLLAGCASNPQTTLVPRAEVSQKIQDLFVATIWWGLAVVIPVELALFYAALRFRHRADQDRGAPVGRHGSTRLEIAWTIVPVLILAVIAVPTVQVIFATAQVASPRAVQVRVIAHQWWWEFRYPQLHIVTANELHLPVGQTANFSLTSADVIHSFWIPAFDGKRDVFPNHDNALWFTPGVVGTFPGQCAEFCGPSHAYMAMTTIVQSRADFDAWVREQQRSARAMVSGQAASSGAGAEARAGATVFAQGTCVGCHTIAGTSAVGQVGPNLTHVGSRVNIGWQLLTNTPANMARWIANPSSFKPGALMPAQRLSNSNMKAVVAYLESLK